MSGLSEFMYAFGIGALVTAGPCACSWTVDSGYIPFTGTMCRRAGSVVGCSKSAWLA
jgi:hypothetical protein